MWRTQANLMLCFLQEKKQELSLGFSENLAETHSSIFFSFEEPRAQNKSLQSL
jgi:hypothetical protein